MPNIRALLRPQITIEYALPEEKEYPLGDQVGVAEQWMKTMSMPNGERKTRLRRNLILIAHRRGWTKGLPVGWAEWLRRFDPQAEEMLRQIRRQ